ncbi:MAG: DUF5696 domain-containing protein [Defluviitaleaceae bacterium]|nr:DUF5696 domain-containing protein [Defluviitaleaceae bacterium]
MKIHTWRQWRNRLIFVGVVALGILAFVLYINFFFTIYDASYLITRNDFGPARPFEPLTGTAALVDGKVRAAETDYIALYISQADTNIAVADLRCGTVWFSSPSCLMYDDRANEFWRNTMRSHVSFRFYDEVRLRRQRSLFVDSAVNEQFEIFSVPGGVRIEYVIGNLDIGIDALPFFIEESVFEERVRGRVETTVDRLELGNRWFPSREKPGFMQMTDGIRDSRIHTDNMLYLFYRIGWTYEETVAANARAGVVPEVEFDYFRMTIEFVLNEDRLIANLPLSQFTTTTQAQALDLNFMTFFGAGNTDAKGFMLVPSGAGGIIMFDDGTTGRRREEPFMSAVYGMDSLTHIIRPQVEQPVRLPVLGIQNNGAAILAHVTSGAALATANAEVAGRVTGYNRAWFSFTLRSSTAVAMQGIPGATGDMTIVQQEIYGGDITLVYHFLPYNPENPPGVGEMAQTYQNFLVQQGVLTPLQGPGNRSFYMDIVGAIDVRRHVLGVPYSTTEVMTTLADAERFVDLLSGNNINTVQMQLHGWFNRGVNHDVAKNVRLLNSVGTSGEMQDLNARLQALGGGLHPAVNFQAVHWDSRNFNRRFESAKHLTGYVGFIATETMRDMLSRWASNHYHGWFTLVHPGALPFHIDSFLPAFERRTAMDGLTLTDLGDLLTESLFRRDAVDRETARLIVEAQLARIHTEIPNLVISGGNDYALRFASHIIDAPTQADLQYIIDYEVPFFPMVIHGFIEFAGASANLRENYSPTTVLLNSMTTGASPRYTFTARPTRRAQFSPHENLYSTYYQNWMDAAVEHYHIFNEVFAPLRAETIIGFEVLQGRGAYIGGQQVTVTIFSNGTRIYVNNTSHPFSTGEFEIPPEWFAVIQAEEA